MVSNIMKFWLTLIFLIPSFLCALFVIYHLLSDRTLRHGLNNHIIIVLLFMNLIVDVTAFPWMLYFYQQDGIWERSLIFCEIWTFLDWGPYAIQQLLFAWATIERHILIFHDRWVLTKKKRFFVHYLPIIVILTYCLIYYIILIFFSPCPNDVDLSSLVCASSCLYAADTTLLMWDAVFHQILPICIIVVFSIGLLIRILWQKFRMHQGIQWRKYRKMAIQLFSISLLYFLFSFPFAILYTVELCGFSDTIIYDINIHLLSLSYFMPLLFPFVCALSLCELRTKLKNIFYLRCQTGIVHPIVINVRPIINHQIPNH